MFVKNQLLEPFFGISSIKMSLDIHLDLLLFDLGSSTGNWALYVSTNTFLGQNLIKRRTFSNFCSNFVDLNVVLPLQRHRGIKFGSLYPKRLTNTSPLSSGNEILTVVLVRLQG